jgi:hypothetical protein
MDLAKEERILRAYAAQRKELVKWIEKAPRPPGEFTVRTKKAIEEWVEAYGKWYLGTHYYLHGIDKRGVNDET